MVTKTHAASDACVQHDSIIKESCLQFGAANENERHRLLRFSNACKGIPQGEEVMNNSGYISSVGALFVSCSYIHWSPHCLQYSDKATNSRGNTTCLEPFNHSSQMAFLIAVENKELLFLMP
nr:hypothetical protein [Tanacetum cinerariifolium]